MRCIPVIVIWLLAAAPVLAQLPSPVPLTPPVDIPATRSREIPVTPPAPATSPARPTFPEDSVPEAERLTFLERYIEGEMPVEDRRVALNRALRLAAQKDDATLAAWQSRAAAFYRREAARINVAALPKPPTPCDRQLGAGSTLPACEKIPIVNYNTGDLYEIAAEAARLDGDHARELNFLEAAVIIKNGPAPHFSYWVNLAARAADAGQDTAARRVCNYLHASQYRVTAGADPFATETNCKAYAALKAQRWADWLALRAPAFAAAKPSDTETLLSYCIAFAQSGARKEAQEACGKTLNAMAAHSARLASAVANPDQSTAMQATAGANGQAASISEQITAEMARRKARTGKEVTMAAVVADLWAVEWAKINAAVSACRRIADTGATDKACVYPDEIRTLNITFKSREEMIADFLGRTRGGSAVTAPQAPRQ